MRHKWLFLTPLILPMLVISLVWLDRNRQATVDDIREAVFRHQLQSTYNPPPVSFLKVEDAALSSEALEMASLALCKRLKDLKKTLRVASPRLYRHGPYVDIVDRATGQSGIIYSVYDISWTKWYRNDEVDVSGGWLLNGTSGESHLYHLRHNGQGWRVAYFEVTGVS